MKKSNLKIYKKVMGITGASVVIGTLSFGTIRFLTMDLSKNHPLFLTKNIEYQVDIINNTPKYQDANIKAEYVREHDKLVRLYEYTIYTEDGINVFLSNNYYPDMSDCITSIYRTYKKEPCEEIYIYVNGKLSHGIDQNGYFTFCKPYYYEEVIVNTNEFTYDLDYETVVIPANYELEPTLNNVMLLKK